MQLGVELLLYVILDDHLEKPGLFVVEPPRLVEIKPSINIITSVDWEEEVSFYGVTKVVVSLGNKIINIYISFYLCIYIFLI